MDTLSWLLPDLSQSQWLAHGLVFFINISLFIFARPIVNLIDSNRQSEAKVSIFRSLNILVLGLPPVRPGLTQDQRQLRKLLYQGRPHLDVSLCGNVHL